ncbi:MAG: hypothetical protein Q8Q09_14330 [Deltaproteobacteria bacterium]|nr:hypothetical protein [Deltaproteobacteria bacterium]
MKTHVAPPAPPSGLLSLTARQRLLPILCSLLLMLPMFAVGHYNDDWAFHLILDGHVPVYPASPHRLYEFSRGPAHTPALIDAGALPWWTEPTFRLRFFRPLSSLSFALDHYVFRASPMAAHVQSALVYALVLWLFSRLIALLLPERSARYTLWLLALSSCWISPVAWPSARNGLWAAAFALMALNTHAHDRVSARPVRYGWALLALLASSLCGEHMVGALPMLLGIEWALTPNKTWRDRGIACAPYIAFVAAFAVFYKLMGFGAGGSGLYLDPVRDVGRALREFAPRMSALMIDATLGVPSELYGLLIDNPVAYVVAGALVAAVSVASLVRLRRASPVREHRVICALWCASSFAIAPTIFGVLGGRLLMLAVLGPAALLGAIAALAMQQVRVASAPARLRAWAVLASLLFVRGVFAVLVREGQIAQMVAVSRAQQQIPINQQIRCPNDAMRLIVNASDPAIGMYAAPTLLYHQPTLRGGVQTLSVAPAEHTLTRTGINRMELSVATGSLTGFAFGQVFRSLQSPIAVGTVLHQGALSVRVLDSPHGQPSRVELAVPTSFDDPRVCLVRWHSQRLESVAAPALGGSLKVAFERGPFGF